MIVPQHKLLFIHITKTAGQSITEFILKNINAKIDIDNNLNYGLLLNKDNLLPGPSHYHHLFLSEYLENKIIPVNDIESYFKFAVLRNPFDRFVSAYYFQELYKQYDSYYDFTAKITKLSNKNDKLYRMFCPQIEYILPVGNTNKFFTVDNINDAFEFLCKRYNFKSITIHKNQNKYKVNKLDSKTQDFIKDFYFDDFELFHEVKNERRN